MCEALSQMRGEKVIKYQGSEQFPFAKDREFSETVVLGLLSSVKLKSIANLTQTKVLKSPRTVQRQQPNPKQDVST